MKLNQKENIMLCLKTRFNEENNVAERKINKLYKENSFDESITICVYFVFYASACIN